MMAMFMVISKQLSIFHSTDPLIFLMSIFSVFVSEILFFILREKKGGIGDPRCTHLDDHLIRA